MSRQVFETDGLIVTRLIGPASAGADRTRWQFTPLAADYVTLDRRQVRALIVVLLRDVTRNVEDA